MCLRWPAGRGGCAGPGAADDHHGHPDAGHGRHGSGARDAHAVAAADTADDRADRGGRRARRCAPARLRRLPAQAARHAGAVVLHPGRRQPGRMKIQIRKGQAPAELTRAEFGHRFRLRFSDPAYAGERAALDRLEAIAWDALQDGRKGPLTRPAGRGFAAPAYEVSAEWMGPSKRLRAAQKRWQSADEPSRVLLICGSARNDGTCPGEMSKTWRLTEIARRAVEQAGLVADVLDLSLVTSEYGRNIHPCKGCVSTAMPLCHWPCSCYPNH